MTAFVIGHPVHVRDIAIPAGVTVLDDADATVCVVSIPKVVVEEAVAVEAVEGAAEPEVIRKAKAEGEEEDAGDKPEKAEKEKK